MENKRLLYLFAAAVLAAAALIVIPWLSDKARGSGLLRPSDRPTVALGKKVYEANCAACHGADLEGEPNWRSTRADGTRPAPPHDETGHTWHHADKVLFELTKFGLAKFAGSDVKTAMPAYEGKLTDEEIIAALSYIKSRWPEAVRKRHDQLNEATKGKSD